MQSSENGGHIADRITDACFMAYDSLGKKGKPEKGREWTKMACIVKTDSRDSVEVITLATGTKCIGENARNAQGTILNDSHAEILARRLFLKYLYHQIGLKGTLCCESVLEDYLDTGWYRVKDGIKFHLFSTDAPCGDASIFPKIQNSNSDGNEIDIIRKRKCNHLPVENEKKRKFYEIETSTSEKDDARVDHSITKPLKNKVTNSNESDNSSCMCDQAEVKEEVVSIAYDVHRTGAKCVSAGKQDLLQPGAQYHETGVLRIKPGRGERTVSMSCSDKLLKWCTLGINGGLLSNFLEKPIFLSSITISNNDFDITSMHRAISLRERKNDELLEVHVPCLYNSKRSFCDGVESISEKISLYNGRITPSGTAILWCGAAGVYEVSALGRKHGITRKNIHSPKASTAICKKSLFEDFKTSLEITGRKASIESHSTYFDCKHASEEYVKIKTRFFNVFADWTKKPKEHEQFL